MPKINELLKDYRELHSEFQIDNFIIGSQGDAWAQYKQCLREIKSRRDTLSGDYAKLKAIEHMAKKRFFITSKSMAKTKIVREQIKPLLYAIAERERELKRFMEIATELKKNIGELTEEKRARLEADSWINKGRRLAAIDILCMGRISPQTADFILSLPERASFDLIEEVQSTNPKALYYKSKGHDENEIKFRIKTDDRKRIAAKASNGSDLHNNDLQAFGQRARLNR